MKESNVKNHEEGSVSNHQEVYLLDYFNINLLFKRDKFAAMHNFSKLISEMTRIDQIPAKYFKGGALVVAIHLLELLVFQLILPYFQWILNQIASKNVS